MQKIELQLTLPNQLTLLRVLLTPVFAALLLADSPGSRQAALGVFLAAALTDWYDGWIARRSGTTSRWGKFLDPLADKVLSATALLVYAGLGLVDAWMVWIVIGRDFLITGLRTYGELRNVPIATSRGAQAKTFGQFVVIYYILILYVARTFPPVAEPLGGLIDTLMAPQVLFGMMLLVTITTVATGLAYLFENRKLIREICRIGSTARP
ncbi:MAG: CDP-diacylglycerol--glycerol-3-phosphate 3-phosphatidyltransferase [Bacteroidota bacterium]